MKNPLIISIYLIISSILLSCQDEAALNNPIYELKGQLTLLPKKANTIAIDFNSKEEMIQFLSLLEKGKLSSADSIKVFELSLKSMNDSLRQNFLNRFRSDTKIQLLGSEDEIEFCSDCLNNKPNGSIRFSTDWFRHFSANFSWNKNGEIENVTSRLDGFFFGGSYVQDYWNQFGSLQPNGDLQFVIAGHWEIIVSVNGSLNFGYSNRTEEMYITYNTITGYYSISSHKPSAWKIK